MNTDILETMSLFFSNDFWGHTGKVSLFFFVLGGIFGSILPDSEHDLEQVL